MIHYRDMTFCPYYRDCDYANNCPRPLTPQVIAAANRLGLPISQFGGLPHCHSSRTLTMPECHIQRRHVLQLAGIAS